MADIASLSDVFDGDTFETVEESPFSYITRAQFLSSKDGPAIAIKSASYLPEFSKEPHDIVKELKILRSVTHSNIIEVLGSTTEPAIHSLHYWMPFIPHCLPDLINSVNFTPSRGDAETVLAITRSLILQVTIAVQYLRDHDIAHRDIKPRNILITSEGVIKLIDFGISWSEEACTSSESMWHEPRSQLCSQVCSGPYRAPETIFSATDYDPFALDLWSLGATFAEFFTSLRFIPEDDDIDDGYGSPSSDGSNQSQSLRPAFINPPVSESQRGEWTRESLFDAERGSIGLAWSIFKVRGTPDDDNWPMFKQLPNATSVIFQRARPIHLRTLLPNLPPDEEKLTSEQSDEPPSHFPPPTPVNSALDFLWRLLVYPPEQRMKPAKALNHPWIREHPLLLPAGYSLSDDHSEHIQVFTEMAGSSLGELLHRFLRGVES
ncbi:kinase-like domain-containing protein [Irpex lacteus]|nr:kinase-like domain-containing protein [Irpex lacteus]